MMWVGLLFVLVGQTVLNPLTFPAPLNQPVMTDSGACHLPDGHLLSFQPLPNIIVPKTNPFPLYQPPVIRSWFHHWIHEKIDRHNEELAQRIYKKKEKMPLWLKFIDFFTRIRIKTKFYWGRISLHTLKVDAQIYLVF